MIKPCFYFLKCLSLPLILSACASSESPYSTPNATTTGNITSPDNIFQIGSQLSLKSSIPLNVIPGDNSSAVTETDYFMIGNDDSSVVIVSNFNDQLDSNPSFLRQLHSTTADASTQLSNFTTAADAIGTSAASRVRPLMSGNGSKVVWYSTGNPTGGNADNSLEIFVLDVTTSTISQLTDNDSLENVRPTITTDGSLVTFVSSADLVTQNSGLNEQIFTITTDGTNTISQVSSFTADYIITGTSAHQSNDARSVTISGDGSLIAFVSNLDVLGDSSNADGSDELFTITIGGTVTQQTNLDIAGSFLFSPMLSETGEIAIVLNNIDSPSAGSIDVYRTQTSTSTTVKYITNWYNASTAGPDYTQDYIDLSPDGSSVVFVDDTSKALKLVDSNASISDITPTQVQTLATDFIAFPQIHSSGTSISFLSSINFNVNSSLPVEQSIVQVYTLAL